MCSNFSEGRCGYLRKERERGGGRETDQAVQLVIHTQLRIVSVAIRERDRIVADFS